MLPSTCANASLNFRWGSRKRSFQAMSLWRSGIAAVRGQEKSVRPNVFASQTEKQSHYH